MVPRLPVVTSPRWSDQSTAVGIPVNCGGNDSEVNVTKRSELNWNETGEPAQFQSRVVPSLVHYPSFSLVFSLCSLTLRERNKQSETWGREG